ncbi:hypothetical protein QYE76_021825 [Lolium multiflorum]|uniref:Transposase (putative) gypsy type domain-containing protein n=1 Tax=Lolium multiflorum TaxID=4521 RepID=A0AAD8VTH5_LOLMU|nr:hypothetical protein QYE76_021825 [Lolium multiflorum]
MATEDLEWLRSKISNQDMNLLKRMGFTKKKDALRFPHEESYPSPPMEYRVSFVDHLIRGLSPPIHEFLRGLLFVYGLQLHQLTPNSILHVSIFITLCECFLGVQPNWAMWKRIFCLRRNGSHGVAYNIGGVVICVRSTSITSTSNSPIPSKGGAREALMTRIRELQSTRGKELSGIQITAYFLRIRVQPLQARKNPLWMYAGDEDVERLSTDLSAKDLEKLIRRISKLSKKDTVPSSCKVKPFCSTNPLPEGHLVLSSLPPLPEGGEVEERAVVTDDNQGASRPESGVGGSQKSAASLEKENETEVTSSTRSSLPAASPKGKRKRDETIDSGASKADTSRAEKTAPNAGEKTLDLYDAALISSDDEEEDAPIDETARTSTSRTLVVSEARPDGDETSPPQQNPEHPTPAPFMKELIRFGTQFIGYRDYAGKLEEKLAEANRRADALATELEQSETARMKAEAKAATVEDLQKRLDDAKRALEENVAQHSAREEEILGRLESQSRRFVRRTHQEYELENPEDDELLDALSLLEIHSTEARNGLAEAEAGLSRLFPYFFKKKEEPAVFIDLAKCFTSNADLGLQLRQEGLKVGVKAAGGTFMSITLGAATKLLDDMMINYSEWHTERAPQGKKVNSVEETSSLNDKIDVIMSMLVNGRSNVDPNNVPLASLVAQEENVDVNFIKNNNFNNNAYRNNSGNNYRPYPSANGNGYGNSYGNSYNNNRNVPSGLEAMLKEFISTQTAFNKSVEEKLDKIDTIASRVDRLASDVNILKLKVMPNNDIDNKITTTANAIQVRINENIRLMAELRARWDREENEKLAKENNVAKVWTITTTSNANSSHVAAPPTINGKIIGVGNVSTPSAKRTKLPEIAKTAETACDKTAEIFSNLGNNDPIAVAHNDLDFDDCHISEVIKFLQKLAKSPNASAINLAFTKHITNALIKAREEKLKLETSIPRKLEDGWEPIIKMKFNDFEWSYFCTKLPKTEEITKWGHEAARGVAGAAPLGPSWPLALTLRLLKASVAKPQYREPRYGKPYRDAAAANPISGIQEIASGTLPERGFISRRTLHRHGRLRSDE